MVAEGDAVMDEIYHMSGSRHISRSRGPAMKIWMQFVPAQSVAHHQIEYTTPASATALRMIVAMPAASRVKIRLGSNAMLAIVVRQSVTALIWIMQIGAPRALPVHPRKCLQRAVACSPWRETTGS